MSHGEVAEGQSRFKNSHVPALWITAKTQNTRRAQHQHYVERLSAVTGKSRIFWELRTSFSKRSGSVLTMGHDTNRPKDTPVVTKQHMMAKRKIHRASRHGTGKFLTLRGRFRTLVAD